MTLVDNVALAISMTLLNYRAAQRVRKCTSPNHFNFKMLFFLVSLYSIAGALGHAPVTARYTRRRRLIPSRPLMMFHVTSNVMVGGQPKYMYI